MAPVKHKYGGGKVKQFFESEQWFDNNVKKKKQFIFHSILLAKLSKFFESEYSGLTTGECEKDHETSYTSFSFDNNNKTKVTRCSLSINNILSKCS